MKGNKRAAHRAMSTPAVLAAASAMVSIGVVAALGPSFLATSDRDDERESAPLRIETDTPEAAAESYLDAYRRREHEAALALSVGAARAEAEARKLRDARATPEELAAKQRLWDRMAAPRLSFVVTRREEEAGAIRLEGSARGSFLEHPYVREVRFEVVPSDGQWRVRSMELGAILEGPDVAGSGEQ